MRDNFVGSLIGGPTEVSVREGLPGQEGRGVTHPAIERPSYGWGCNGGENNEGWGVLYIRGRWQCVQVYAGLNRRCVQGMAEVWLIMVAAK